MISISPFDDNRAYKAFHDAAKVTGTVDKDGLGSAKAFFQLAKFCDDQLKHLEAREQSEGALDVRFLPFVCVCMCVAYRCLFLTRRNTGNQGEAAASLLGHSDRQHPAGHAPPALPCR